MAKSAEHKRIAAITHAGFLMAHGRRSIGYEYGGGLDWLEQSMHGMEHRFAEGEHWYPDCRATIDWIIKWSGWKPFRVGGYRANSAEAWESLPHYWNIADAHPGALVVYGWGGDAHIAMVTARDGNNPWLFSHGSAFSPNRVRYQDETIYHARLGQPVTLLSSEPLIS